MGPHGAMEAAARSDKSLKGTKMRIHEVVLVPGCGHSTDTGEYDRGRSIARISEVDAVAIYARALAEELEAENIRYRVLPTHEKPGIRYSERHTHVGEKNLVMHLRVGFHKISKPNELKYNVSHVFYGNKDDSFLARVVSDCLNDWGNCSSFGHRRANPGPDYEDLVISNPKNKGIRIEPFIINGPNLDDYFMRLSHLGRDLGRCISFFLRDDETIKARKTLNTSHTPKVESGIFEKYRIADEVSQFLEK